MSRAPDFTALSPLDADRSRTCVIVNPAAGRGRGARKLPSIRAAFAAEDIHDVRLTTPDRRDEAVAREALADGCTTIVAAGGDGTWSNVANAILTSNMASDCRLALIAAGTGNDFAKSLGVQARDPVAVARSVSSGVEMTVDAGRIEDRFFLNCVGFGFDVAVLAAVANIGWLRGDALYLYAALRELSSFAGIDIDDGAAFARYLLFVVANAPRFGGAFRIAPDASLFDGRLDSIAVGDAGTLRRLRLLASATRGAHIALPEVRSGQATSTTLRFRSPPEYETDGELRQARSDVLEIRCVSDALRMVATPAARQ